MSTLFPPEKLRKYPHLMVSDVAIWERYLDKFADLWDAFGYDVRVGEGITPDPSHPDYMRKMAVALTEKRIDVVAHRGSITTLIEVKPSAMLSAIGQLLSYQILYEERYPVKGPVKMILITDRAGPDLANLCRKFGISLVVV